MAGMILHEVLRMPPDADAVIGVAIGAAPWAHVIRRSLPSGAIPHGAVQGPFGPVYYQVAADLRLM